MNIRPLIIDNSIREKISNLVSHAENNILTIDDLLDTYNKEMQPVGDMEGYSVNLPFGYRVVYSIEDQSKSKVRHLSMSVDEENKLPNIEAVREVMKLIGFENDIKNCYVALEDIAPNRKAINILEKIKPQ